MLLGEKRRLQYSGSRYLVGGEDALLDTEEAEMVAVLDGQELGLVLGLGIVLACLRTHSAFELELELGPGPGLEPACGLEVAVRSRLPRGCRGLARGGRVLLQQELLSWVSTLSQHFFEIFSERTMQ